ncbi:MAG: 4'-phosphopantetheinyl transferase family protein [Acetatifactor sp.]
MQDRIYLLDLEELLKDKQASSLVQSVDDRLDVERLEKVRRIRGRTAQAASRGAGLLIQKAVAERELTAAFFRRYSVRELLAASEGMGLPLPLEYRYGVHGKPYLKEIPIQFSISHSGRFVLCAVSEREIGADIQRMEDRTRVRRLAERFFAEDEKQFLAGCEREEELKRRFYELWTKKEALGKLTGEGIFTNKTTQPVRERRDLDWLEVPAPEGYVISVCRHKQRFT